MDITVYRKNYKGKMCIIGHLSPEGHEHHYATILDPNESIEQQRESHRNRCCKNKLGFYVPLALVKEQLRKDKASIELGKGK